jgi:hypothetical protein
VFLFFVFGFGWFVGREGEGELFCLMAFFVGAEKDRKTSKKDATALFSSSSFSLTSRLRTSVVASSDTAMLYVMCRNSRPTRYMRPSCSRPSKET